MTEQLQDDPTGLKAIADSVAHLPITEQFEGMLEEIKRKSAVFSYTLPNEENHYEMDVHGIRLVLEGVNIKRILALLRDGRGYRMERDWQESEIYEHFGNQHGYYAYTSLNGKLQIGSGEPTSFKQIVDKSPTVFFEGKPEELWRYPAWKYDGLRELINRYQREGYKQVILFRDHAHRGLANYVNYMYGFGPQDRVMDLKSQNPIVSGSVCKPY